MRWLAFLLAANAFAASLADLQATAGKLRAQRQSPPGMFGESPLLTVFKHQLREWVESRMAAEIANPQSVSHELNRDLTDEGLMCKEAACDDQNGLGYLADLRLNALGPSPDWLVLVTGVGIECGTDESVYIYERVGGRWTLRLEIEQTQYDRDRYKPQQDIQVLSTADSGRQPLVLIRRISVSCGSSWQTASYRLARLGEPKPLLDGQHVIDLGKYNLEMRLTADEVFLPFSGTVLHYKIEGDQVRRIEPLASSPALFVDEWRASPWSEVAEWSGSSLASWHAQVKEPQLIFGFWDAVTLCLKRPGQWQIEAEIDHEAVYFLVEERAPSSYRMLDVSTDPHSGCEP